MAIEHEYGYKTRVLRILTTLVESPYRYTKKQLAQQYGVSIDTISNDFNAISIVGFMLDFDSNYRYGLKQIQPYTQLKDLLHFSEEDQMLLHQAIDQIAAHTKRGKVLKKKLAALYDFKRLGYAYLKKPYLTKVDLLMEAKEEKLQIILEDYQSSNSNIITHRRVEPFYVSPPEDTLQAYDIDKKGLRHFRISRIKRVKLLEEKWENEGSHTIQVTDPFRIVDNNQRMVELVLKVGARNELIERFPLTKAYITDGVEENTYHFQCMVNHKYYGLMNFILGYYHQGIEIVEPDDLLVHLRLAVGRLGFDD